MEMKLYENSAVFEDATIIFMNFSGRKSLYNQNGYKTFSILLTPEDADRLIEAGYSPKELPVREEGDEPRWHLPVKLGYTGRPPKVVMVHGITKQKTDLTEETISLLDRATVDVWDVAIRPYHWEVNGKTGTKAYLKTLYAVLAVDEFEEKYAPAPFA